MTLPPFAGDIPGRVNRLHGDREHGYLNRLQDLPGHASDRPVKALRTSMGGHRDEVDPLRPAYVHDLEGGLSLGGPCGRLRSHRQKPFAGALRDLVVLHEVMFVSRNTMSVASDL